MKRPWVLYSDKYEWPSHRYIIPSIIGALKKVSCHVVNLERINRTITPEILQKINNEASVIILTAPLTVTLNVLRTIRNNNQCQVPAVIVTSCQMMMGGWMLFLYRLVLRTTDYFVAPCTPESQLFRWALSKGANVCAIPYTVGNKGEAFHRATNRREIRNQFGFRPNEKLILYAGRLTPQKNIHKLLELIYRARAYEPHIKLIMAGAFADESFYPHELSVGTEYRESLLKLIEEKKLGPNIRFMGQLKRKKLWDLMAICDVQMSLTLFQGEEFGYSIAEGMMMGCPTLITRWGGGVDFVDGGGAKGVPVEVLDGVPDFKLEEARKALLKLLNKDQKVIWSRRARKYWRQNISGRAVEKKWSDLITNISSSKVTTDSVQLGPQFLEFSMELARESIKSKKHPDKRHLLRLSPKHPFRIANTHSYFINAKKVYAGQSGDFG